MAKSGVLLVNYVKRFVRRWRLRLKLNLAKMVHDAQRFMILICLNVFIVVFVKKPVRLMRLC